MPTTAAQPYFHQPSVAHFHGHAGTPAGSTLLCTWRLRGQNVVVLGMETTRTAIFLSASRRCAFRGQLHFRAGGNDHGLGASS